MYGFFFLGIKYIGIEYKKVVCYNHSMEAKDFEIIFNSVKNKSIDLAELNPETKAEKIFAKAIINASRRKSHEGASKECSFFGEKNLQYALLKHKKSVKKADMQFEADAEVIKFNNWLISKGFNIPKLYTLFYADQHYYEVFDRAAGKEISLVGHSNILTQSLGKDATDKMIIIKPNLYQRLKMNRYLYSFNIKNQKILVDLPQEKYDELFRQYKELYDMGFHTLDTNAGNLMVSPNGFTMIDLDIKSTLGYICNQLPNYDKKLDRADNVIKFCEAGNKLPPPYLYPNTEEEAQDQLCANFIFPFCASRFHQHLLSERQCKNLYLNDMKILTKVVNAITNNNMQFNLLESKTRNHLLFTLNNRVAHYYEVCDAQVQLQDRLKAEKAEKEMQKTR